MYYWYYFHFFHTQFFRWHATLNIYKTISYNLHLCDNHVFLVILNTHCLNIEWQQNA